MSKRRKNYDEIVSHVFEFVAGGVVYTATPMNDHPMSIKQLVADIVAKVEKASPGEESSDALLELCQICVPKFTKETMMAMTGRQFDQLCEDLREGLDKEGEV